MCGVCIKTRLHLIKLIMHFESPTKHSLKKWKAHMWSETFCKSVKSHIIYTFSFVYCLKISPPLGHKGGFCLWSINCFTLGCPLTRQGDDIINISIHVWHRGRVGGRGQGRQTAHRLGKMVMQPVCSNKRCVNGRWWKARWGRRRGRCSK